MRRLLALFLLLSLICLPASAAAQDSRFYAGLKLGSMVPDVDSSDSSGERESVRGEDSNWKPR